MEQELFDAQERAEPVLGARPASFEPEGPGSAERDAGEPELFTIKYMGEEVPVTREELIRLAQKGRDYDRIRGRAEKLARRVRELERAAGPAAEGGGKANAGPVTRVSPDPAEAAGEDRPPGAEGGEAFSPEGGEVLFPEDAGEAVFTGEDGEALYLEPESGGPKDAEGLPPDGEAPEDRVEEVSRPAGEREAEASLQPSGEEMAEARRREEIDAFLRVYGPVDPGEIPRAVWREVSRGVPLLAAYQAYENRLLRAALEAERLMRSNALRAVGSGATAGGRVAGDAIEDDWYRGD